MTAKQERKAGWLKRLMERRDKLLQTVFCESCGESNERRRIRCFACGNKLI